MTGNLRAVFALTLAGSCAPSLGSLPPAPPQPTNQCPLFDRDPMKPDLMAWDAGQRADVSRLREEGVIAVRYEAVGCDVKIEVVPDCIGSGKWIPRTGWRRLSAGRLKS